MQIALFLCGVKVPDNVIWKPDDTVAGDFSKLREALGFDLMVDWLVREVDAWRRIAISIKTRGQGTEEENDTFTVQICSYKKAYSANAIQGDYQCRVIAPVSDFSHVPPFGLELRITCKVRK